ncbi:MAG: hypothetical protein DRP13_00795 [Candidatus Aenigmatarchaeota archaeon]|nr:MAG: hypothetical protein DRP13_00795 [Candidatus Aenigmarchaeota archaeon]
MVSKIVFVLVFFLGMCGVVWFKRFQTSRFIRLYAVKKGIEEVKCLSFILSGIDIDEKTKEKIRNDSLEYATRFKQLKGEAHIPAGVFGRNTKARKKKKG